MKPMSVPNETPLPDRSEGPLERLAECPSDLSERRSRPFQLSRSSHLPRNRPSPPGRLGMCWRCWCSPAVVVFVFSLVALFIARSLPAYRDVPASDLATNARVVIGAQAAAYPLVLLFMFVLVRSRTARAFREGDPLELAGNLRAGIFRSGDHSGGGRSMACRAFCPFRSRCRWTSTSTMPPAPT